MRRRGRDAVLSIFVHNQDSVIAVTGYAFTSHVWNENNMEQNRAGSNTAVYTLIRPFMSIPDATSCIADNTRTNRIFLYHAMMQSSLIIIYLRRYTFGLAQYHKTIVLNRNKFVIVMSSWFISNVAGGEGYGIYVDFWHSFCLNFYSVSGCRFFTHSLYFVRRKEY